jgi:Cu+-exporting ATPase
MVSIDESMITGEPEPVSKGPGEIVTGGTINEEGVMIIKVTAAGSASVLSQIVRLVEEAQTKKPPVQAYADAIAGVFAPFVVVCAMVTYVTWLTLLFTETVPLELFKNMAHLRNEYDIALHFAIATIVVACPCTFGLATPTAVMVGTGVGAQNGVLIKGGDVLELCEKVRTVVFDKTGTLTVGKLKVVDITFLSATALEGKEGQQKALRNICSVERENGHPVARSICNYADEANDGEGGSFCSQATPATDFQSFTGKGVSGTVSGHQVLVGNRTWIKERLLQHEGSKDDDSTSFADDFAKMETLQLQHPKSTTVLAAIDGKLVAVITLMDLPHQDSKHVDSSDSSKER